MGNQNLRKMAAGIRGTMGRTHFYRVGISFNSKDGTDTDMELVWGISAVLILFAEIISIHAYSVLSLNNHLELS